MYTTTPRRHSRRTLSLLLVFYAGAGMIGIVSAILVGGGFVVAGADVTPERFAIAMLVTAPIGLTAALMLWHRYVRPRIQLDREQAFAAFEAFKRRFGLQ
jgi:hypothetical protein